MGSNFKRSQVLVPVPMSQRFIDELKGALARLGYSNRSDFIRDAILEKLKNEGEPIHPSMAAAPARTGKGGRPRRVSSGATEVADRGVRLLAEGIKKPVKLKP